jgi:predicted dehydrogenase
MDPEIDAVIIGLPTHLHLECASQAAEAKKHVFLEKPIARSVQEAEEIILACQRNSVKLMVGYPLRFNAEFCKLKEKITSGVLGDIEVANATFISSGPFYHRSKDHAPVPVPEWWFKKELTGGGALVDLSCHLINLTRWYFGEITDIRSYLGYRYNFDFEDHAICLAQFESGTTAAINVGWFSQEYQLKVELLGTIAHAKAQHIPETRLVATTQMLSRGTSEFHRPHLAELQCFVHCLTHDLNPTPSGKDGLKDLEAITRAYKNRIHLD